jgi:hypothetical protein
MLSDASAAATAKRRRLSPAEASACSYCVLYTLKEATAPAASDSGADLLRPLPMFERWG